MFFIMENINCFNPLEWANKNNSVDNKVNNTEMDCASTVDNIGELVNAIEGGLCSCWRTW